MKDNICLITIFNHRYDKNIDKLEKLYKGKFNEIYHLVPFYNGTRKNVIPVFESGSYFSNHIAQGKANYINDKYSHYVFIADDLLLNPSINSDNLLTELNISSNTAYIKNLASLASIYYLWIYLTRSLTCFENTGINFIAELPSKEEATKRFEHFGLSLGNLSLRNMLHWTGRIKLSDLKLFSNVFTELFGLLKNKPLPYPLAAAYSDFIIIPKESIKEFSRLCGVFGALNLFAEVAIPTAMILSCDNIVTELLVGENWVNGKSYGSEVLWKGTEIWLEKDLNDIETDNSYKIASLFKNLKKNELYIHPIKLSKWEL